MDEYYRILESLPPALRTPLAKLDAHYAPHIQEIRLRLGQPVQFTICGRLCPAAKFLPGTGLPAALETDTLRDCFLQLCRRSVYAYEDELKQGYFSVKPEIGKLIVGAVLNAVTAMIASGRNRKPKTRQA